MKRTREKNLWVSKQYNKYIKYIYIQASSYFFFHYKFFPYVWNTNLIFIIYFKNSDLLNMPDLSLVWPKHVLYKIGTFPVVNGKTSISFIFFSFPISYHFSFSVMYLILYIHKSRRLFSHLIIHEYNGYRVFYFILFR